MILLDTCVLLWSATNSHLLSRRAIEILESPNESIFVSAASGWEIATKYRIGKLPSARFLLDGFADRIRAQGYTFLSVTIDHSLLAGTFAMDHKDPFDRLIAAQAIVEKMPLLSADRRLDAFPVERVW